MWQQFRLRPAKQPQVALQARLQQQVFEELEVQTRFESPRKKVSHQKQKSKIVYP
jgi:hypothetical protein